MTQTKNTPELFNPTVCLVLTLIFSPIFGAFLQGLNWRALGFEDLFERSIRWVRFTFYTLALYTVSEPWLMKLPFGRYVMIGIFVGFWISWSLSLGIKQISFVRSELGGNYVGRRFGKAIMLGAFGWVAYTALALTIILLLHVTGIDPLPASAPILQK